ncbi:hypothetical protein RJ640_011773 [Escallonia rubra]|uniref:Protein TSSC4 n=1 Tax=Escallonia rubra TaxID=112253 RepID=A0AA88U7K5_9ASTE|nr:hypothetical protein RJ640_011773 [Escallonia rubra]
MATSESVDNSFTSRVQKIFGSLPSPQASPWTLTGEEVEKREWRRDKDDDVSHSRDDDEIPCSSSFDGLLGRNSRRKRKHLEDDPNDDDDEEEDGRSGCGPGKSVGFDGDDDREEWDIRSSIGLDCTLDNEEEEDQYDKLAEGRENAGDRLYMSDVTDHGLYLNSYNVLPDAFDNAPRDPRADSDAALLKLKDDETTAEKLEAGKTCDVAMLDAEMSCDTKSEVGVRPKSILKRKDNSTVKSSKRVRFDPACKDYLEEASEEQEDLSTDAPLIPTNKVYRVPDYLLRPSKYVCYSFDSSSDMDEDSNRQACMDFLEPVKRSKSTEMEENLKDASPDLLKSVSFIPRKKVSEAKGVIHCREENQGNGVGIAAAEVQHDGGVTGEDDPETDTAGNSVGFRRPGRCYRTKPSSEDTVS